MFTLNYILRAFKYLFALHSFEDRKRLAIFLSQIILLYYKIILLKDYTFSNNLVKFPNDNEKFNKS